MKFIEGGVCAAKGFLAAGVYAGIKINPKSKDLALVFSEVPAVAAGVFTSNKIKSACIAVSRMHLKNAKAQAIIINSGNANCCTGTQGLKDAEQMAMAAASALGIKPQDVLVASTGIIGRFLPMGKIINSIPRLSRKLNVKAGLYAAQAIMTTDTKEKQAAVRLKINGCSVTIGAMAKGSGMICPNMATMLAFIVTDAAISASALKAALKGCVDESFNCISVDASMSTNDMCLIMANAAAGNRKITIETKDAFKKFRDGLLALTQALAKMIVKDGEGATKVIEVFVKGAASIKDAKSAARAVCNSNLVKTAIYGRDANWGRIAAAVGASNALVLTDRLSVYFGKANPALLYSQGSAYSQKGGVKVLSNGKPVAIDESVLKKILSEKEIKITVDLGLGSASAKMWTCDFSEEYIRINAKYRT